MRQLAIAQNRGFADVSNIHLLQNFARGCQWFGENGLLIADRIGDDVKIFEGQGKIFGEGAIVVDDS